MNVDPLLAAPFTKAIYYSLILLILLVSVGYFLYSDRDKDSSANEQDLAKDDDSASDLKTS